MKVFLATSISAKVDSQGVVAPEFRAKIEAIIDRYEAAGREVFCAAKAEGWKISTISEATKELQKDFENIKSADEFAALIDDTISGGTQMEIGYAEALGKRITLITEGKTTLGWTNKALSGFPNVTHLVI